MKKNLFYLFALICSMSLFSACSDDDPEFVQTEFDGVYKGTLDVKESSLNIDEKGIPQKVYISKTGENLFKLELKQFAFQGIQIGDIVVENIPVIKKGNNCTFIGSANVNLVVGQCVVAVNGSIEGNSIAITIGVNVASPALKVNVTFNGEKLAADQSSEAKLLTFTFNNEFVIGQPEIDGTNVNFMVSEEMPEAQLKALAPTFSISAGATVDKQSGVSQDFSNLVKYVITSEDGIVKTTYNVSIIGKEKKIAFDDWSVIKSPTTGSKEQYEVPTGLFGTSNPGVMTINEILGSLLPNLFEYAVSSTAGKVGKAAQLKTLYTSINIGGADFNAALMGLIPYVTAGSLFTGEFAIDMSNPLNSTKFGLLHLGEPLTFTGSYKYTAGAVYYDNKNKVVQDKKDQCSIYAVLYEEKLDVKGVNIPLTGNYNDSEAYIGKSNRIVMRAALADGSSKADWTDFSVPFTLLKDKKYDSTKKYYLAVVCSSSAEGDYYMGAPGSTLLVDDFKIISK